MTTDQHDGPDHRGAEAEAQLPPRAPHGTEPMERSPSPCHALPYPAAFKSSSNDLSSSMLGSLYMRVCMCVSASLSVCPCVFVCLCICGGERERERELVISHVLHTCKVLLCFNDREAERASRCCARLLLGSAARTRTPLLCSSGTRQLLRGEVRTMAWLRKWRSTTLMEGTCLPPKLRC